MKAFDDFVKWSYVRYAGLALGVLGGILLLSCLGVISSASSLSSSASSMYSAFGGLSDLYASISNMSSTYAFNFLVLIILTIAIFLKMKTGGRMNYKPGYLFLGSIVVGLLCEGMISSIKNSAFNMFSSSMDSLASSILLLGFLMLLMGALQIAGAVFAFKDKEVLQQTGSSGQSMKNTISFGGKEEDVNALADYLTDNKVNIEFSLNADAINLAKELNLPNDFSKEDILRAYHGSDFMKKRKIMSVFQQIRPSQNDDQII